MAGLPDCFFDAIFHKFGLAFLEAVGVKNNCLAFSFQYLPFFGDSLHMLSDWCCGF